jgi:hypothetical protein
LIFSTAFLFSKSFEIKPLSNIRWWFGHKTTTLSKVSVPPQFFGIIWQTSMDASLQPHMTHSFGKILLTNFRKVTVYFCFPLKAGLNGPILAHLLEQKKARFDRDNGTSKVFPHTLHCFATRFLCAICTHSGEQNFCTLAKLGFFTVNSLPQPTHLRLITSFLCAIHAHLREQNRRTLAIWGGTTKALLQVRHFRITVFLSALARHIREQYLAVFALEGQTLNVLPQTGQIKLICMLLTHPNALFNFSFDEWGKLKYLLTAPRLTQSNASQEAKK